MTLPLSRPKLNKLIQSIEELQTAYQKSDKENKVFSDTFWVIFSETCTEKLHDVNASFTDKNHHTVILLFNKESHNRPYTFQFFEGFFEYLKQAESIDENCKIIAEFMLVFETKMNPFIGDKKVEV